MDDTISRQKAINAMMALQAEDDEAYGCHIPEGFDGERAKEVLAQLPSVQQWTPVQQNPERSGWYIVTKRFGNGETWIGTKWYSTAYGWTGDGILAWMELPEAYKEGE